MFLSDIKDLLEDEGILVLEHADLLSIIKNKMFDTICHEHLEYYSHKVIFNLLNYNGLEYLILSLMTLTVVVLSIIYVNKNVKNIKQIQIK